MYKINKCMHSIMSYCIISSIINWVKTLIFDHVRETFLFFISLVLQLWSVRYRNRLGNLDGAICIIDNQQCHCRISTSGHIVVEIRGYLILRSTRILRPRISKEFTEITLAGCKTKYYCSWQVTADWNDKRQQT